MKKRIVESQADIDGLLKFLDAKIIELRKHPNAKPIMIIARAFYVEVVIPWHDLTFDNNEVTPRDEKIVTDKILDFINILNSFKM